MSTVIFLGEHQRRLYKELLANYNRLERPVVNDSTAILVELGLTLLQIIDVFPRVIPRDMSEFFIPLPTPLRLTHHHDDPSPVQTPSPVPMTTPPQSRLPSLSP
ncbi:unnamed protein product [Arctogadus glacialis]